MNKVKDITITNLICITFIMFTLSLPHIISAGMRGRVSVDPTRNTIVSDQGTLLRGGTFWLSKGHLERLRGWADTKEIWDNVIQQTRLNAIRLACMITPPYGGAKAYTVPEITSLLDSLVDWGTEKGYLWEPDDYSGTISIRGQYCPANSKTVNRKAVTSLCIRAPGHHTHLSGNLYRIDGSLVKNIRANDAFSLFVRYETGIPEVEKER
jgi:hypothetical protein